MRKSIKVGVEKSLEISKKILKFYKNQEKSPTIIGNMKKVEKNL